ncbi:MAG TPA: LuxR C-terminal-related transcriptional regulator [Candidatus Limnocylindrales bacterium]
MHGSGPLVCPVLVGRDDLLALADRRRAQAAGGRGGLLFLAGEAGIGKTRLLGSIERRAAADGFRVLRGAAFPRDLEVAGGVFLDLARSMMRDPSTLDAGAALATCLAQPDPVEPGDRHRARRILVLDVVDLVAGIASSGRAMVSLEDLHWADDLSLEVLGVLARRLADLPLLVVATYRSDQLYPRVPMREWRARLLAGRLAEEARLARLDLDGTATMTTLILGAALPAPRDLVAAIHQRSDGVPLHVEELLGVIRAEGMPAGVVPDTLDEAVAQRAVRLSKPARSVAEAAAVIGRTFDVDLLATVLGRAQDRLSAPLAELAREFFVVPAAEAGRLDFRHAIIRDALYGSITPAARRRLHGRVADAAADDPRFGPAFRSVHLEEAGRGAEAFVQAVEGGRRAAALSAHREALELFTRAWRNAPADAPPTDAAMLLAELATEAAATDDNELADRALADASDRFREAGDPLAAASLVPQQVAVRHLLGDDFAARTARLTAALASMESLPDDHAARAVRARLLGGLSAANMLDRRLELAIAYGRTGRALAIDVGDLPTELDAAASVGSSLVFAGQMQEGWALLESTVIAARDAHLEAQAARAYRMLGSCASVLVEYERADRWLRDGIEYAERVELWNHRHYMAAHLAHVRWATGDWVDAERLATHALSDGRGGITTRITALHVLGFLALGRGDLAAADEALDEALALGRQMAELQRLSPALWGLAEAAQLRGDTAAAIAWCLQGEAASAAVDDAAYLFPFLVTGTRAHLAAGDPTGATAWTERVSTAVIRRGIPGTLPAVDHARGLLDLARGNTAHARTSLAVARDGWRARGRAWEGAWAAIDLATALARSKRAADARVLIDEVRSTAAALPSATLVAGATALDHRLRTRAAAAPWDPLTAREFEVARLIAEGRTNAEIADRLGVSTRTVTSHVEHVLAKLGAARRAEIAAWATRIG